jgi:hypothetical protein
VADLERQRTEELTREIAGILGDVCPPGVGFLISFFTFQPGWTTYASNARRQDMIRELRALAQRLEDNRDE